MAETTKGRLWKTDHGVLSKHVPFSILQILSNDFYPTHTQKPKSKKGLRAATMHELSRSLLTK